LTIKGGVTRALFGLVLLASMALQDRVRAEERFKPFKMKNLEGVHQTLADVLGKATLITFFFPTCKFCNAALPEIAQLQTAYKDQGLSTVWINVVPAEDRLIPQWRSNHGYTIPVLLGGRSVQDDYRLTTTPTHYLVDARGNVLWKHSGHEPGDERVLEREIRHALGLVN
jgi:thiol-disulfide isomerase/thioredoxin